MDKREAFQALKGFLQWFEDNFHDEDWLYTGDDVHPDGEWRSYMDLPDYTHAVDALEFLQKQLD